MRNSRREQRVYEGGLLEAARHELPEHVCRMDAEAVNGTIPGFVAHLVLALDDGHLEGARDGQQAARVALDELVLALAQVAFEFVQTLRLEVERELLVVVSLLLVAYDGVVGRWRLLLLRLDRLLWLRGRLGLRRRRRRQVVEVVLRKLLRGRK